MATIRSYTTIEQSKVLAEILPLESADMWWNFYSVTTNDTTPQIIHLDTPWVGNFNWDNKPDNIPCWSLAALMNMLPSEFTEVGKYSTTTYKIDIRKYALTEDVDLYQIAYGSIKFDVDGQYSFKDMINTGEKENLIDAAFQMICWLKENGKI